MAVYFLVRELKEKLCQYSLHRRPILKGFHNILLFHCYFANYFRFNLLV